MQGNLPLPVTIPTPLGTPSPVPLGATASSVAGTAIGQPIIGQPGTDFYLHQPLPTRSDELSSTDVTRVRIDSAVEPPFETVEAEPSSYFRIKTLVDRSMTLALSLIALPIMAIVALAVMICDGRPIFFRQVRVGKDGCTFRIWKFRTMRRDAERRTGAVWSNATDSRVTKIGRWLRCSHLDELPQFINVLTGEMNLVGPRPERPEFVKPLSEQVPGYMKRTQVRPGITGLAQLRLGYDESFAGIPEKVDCDLRYIRGATCFGDLKLLASTLPYIVRQLHCKLSPTRDEQDRDYAISEKSGSSKPCSAWPTS